jgi:hypothetical protein
MREYSTTARIVGGHLQVRNRQRFDAAIRQFRDGEVIVTVERAYATRSEAQNAYYFGVVLNYLHQHTEQGVDDLHEYCKHRFNATVLMVCDKDGVIIGEERIGQSTAKMNKLTFGEYIERIRQWMLDDLHILTPDPDPNWRTNPEREAA